MVTSVPVLAREAWDLVARPSREVLPRALSVLSWSSLVAFVSLYAATAVLWVGLRWAHRPTTRARLLPLVAVSASPFLLGFHSDLTSPLGIWAAVLLALGLRRHCHAPAATARALACAVYAGPVLVSLAASLFSLQAFRLPSASMVPTLHAGDHVLIARSAPPLPERGDVVVFRRDTSPGGEQDQYIKRVIGLPGDRVERRGRRVFVNEQPLRHCPVGYLEGAPRLAVYLEVHAARSYLVAFDLSRQSPDFGPVVVPQGQLFVLGDNRDSSFDSSRWDRRHGGVAIEDVAGVARMVWFPPTQARWLDEGTPTYPEDEAFEHAIRRCLARR